MLSRTPRWVRAGPSLLHCLGSCFAALEGERLQSVWGLVGAIPRAACWANQYLYLLVLGFSKFTTDIGTLTVSSPLTCTQSNRNPQSQPGRYELTAPQPRPPPHLSFSSPFFTQSEGTACGTLTVTSHQYSPRRVMASSGNFKACGATTTPSCKKSQPNGALFTCCLIKNILEFPVALNKSGSLSGLMPCEGTDLQMVAEKSSHHSSEREMKSQRETGLEDKITMFTKEKSSSESHFPRFSPAREEINATTIFSCHSSNST